MLNNWEQAIVDNLRYATHNGLSATIPADEAHIPMNAMERYAEVRDVIAGIPIDRISEICEAERDGRCYTMPVNIGDTVTSRGIAYIVYHISFQLDEHRNIDDRLRFYATPKSDADDVDDINFWLDDIGKTVFLTRAEAEAVLKEADHA